MDGAHQFRAMTNHTWYKLSGWGYVTAGTLCMAFVASALSIGEVTFTAASWVNKRGTFRAAAANNGTILCQNGATAMTAYVDDVSIKALTLSELMQAIDAGTQNAVVDVNITEPATYVVQGGLVINLDSASSPANFIVIYMNRGNTRIYVDKCLSGTYTNLATNYFTYSAGATLRAIKNGNSLSIYYNNAQIGSTLPLDGAGDDAPIVSNTLHGMFSTDSTITFDNFQCTPLTDTSYGAALDPYCV